MSGLSPSDAAVAVRSFPRRFRGVLARPDDRDAGEGDPGEGDPGEGDTSGEEVDHDELARRPGPEGTSAAQHLLAADAVLALLDRALAAAVGHDDAVLEHPIARLGDAAVQDTDGPLATLLDRFEATAAGCALRVADVPTDDWGRRVRVEGDDTSPSLLEVVQEGVDAVAGHLRAAERTIAAVT